jgi:hypothetical protein
VRSKGTCARRGRALEGDVRSKGTCARRGRLFLQAVCALARSSRGRRAAERVGAGRRSGAARVEGVRRAGQVRVWDVRQGRCSGCFGPGAETLDVLSVALHPSAPLIASGLAGTRPPFPRDVYSRERLSRTLRGATADGCLLPSHAMAACSRRTRWLRAPVARDGCVLPSHAMAACSSRLTPLF